MLKLTVVIDSAPIGLEVERRAQSVDRRPASDAHRSVANGVSHSHGEYFPFLISEQISFFHPSYSITLRMHSISDVIYYTCVT